MLKHPLFQLLSLSLFFLTVEGYKNSSANTFQTKYDPKAVELQKKAVETFNKIQIGEDKKIDSAISLLDQAIQIDPNYSLAYSTKSQFLVAQGELGQAAKVMENMLQRVPEFSEAIVYAGMIHTRLGNQTKAKYWYGKALKLLKSQPEKDRRREQSRISTIGLLLILTGSTMEGKTTLKELKKQLGPDDSLKSFIDELENLNYDPSKVVGQLLGISSPSHTVH